MSHVIKSRRHDELSSAALALTGNVLVIVCNDSRNLDPHLTGARGRVRAHLDGQLYCVALYLVDTPVPRMYSLLNCAPRLTPLLLIA